MKNLTGRYKNFIIQPFTIRQNFFLKVTHKGQKVEKWKVESTTGSPFSLFLPRQKAETFISWQTHKLVATAHHFFGCKLHITFLLKVKNF